MFNPKHACLRGGGEAPQRKAKEDTTQAVGDDIINLVATFASCRDLCTLGCVCRRFAPLPARESLWELRALDILPSRPRLRSAMSELRITSYRQLVEAFTKIGIPGGVLGFWQAEKPSRSWAAQLEFSSRLSSPGRQVPTVEEDEAKGELLKISLAAGRFQCDSIAPNGTSRCIFTIRILPNVNQTVSIHFFSMEGVNPPATPFTNWIPGQSSGWVPVPTGNARTPIRPSGENAFLLHRAGGRTCRFIKLKAPTPPPLPPTASSNSSPASAAAAALQRNSAVPAAAAVAQSLCGLWSAPYGSHGLEIIQLSLDPCSAACGAPPATSKGVVTPGGRAGEEAEVGRGAGARPGMSKRSTATFSSSGKTSSSESVCTSAPATDSSEGGFGGSMASGSASGSGSGSDDSGAEEDREREEGGKMFSSPRVRRVRARAAASNEDDGYGSDTEEEEEEEEEYDNETGAGGGRRAHSSRFAAGRGDGGAAAAAVSGGGGGDALLPPQLLGVKVTGDANVPAGKTSFAIDLETQCDVDAELEADRRPVVLFLPSGALMANLANRRGQMSFWRKGRGQINRIPGRWSPEWVDVDFVAYKAGFSRAFSVVFRQPTQAVRVMMDFERALGFKEEWPQWPASAVPVPCRS